MTAAWARHGDLAAVSHAEARRIAEKVRAPWAAGGPDARRSEFMVHTPAAPARVRIYDTAPDATKPALIYLHGGGWTLFSLDTHDRVMREYAARAGVKVIGVDYALSPEAKFPVALRQVVAVARYIAKNAGRIGIDPRRIAIGGDSAGANLAIAAAIQLRDDGDRDLLRAMVLNYGVFERESSPEACERNGPGSVLTADEMDGFWRNYLRDDSDASDPLACPMRADLAGLPCTLLVVPEFDLLTEQSVRLASRLTAAGVDVQLELYRGATHSFLEAVSIAPLAQKAFDDTARWLRAKIG